MGGLFQINPIWNFGPYNPAQISAGSQPDFYMGWSDGMARLFPAWEIVLGDYTIPAAFWATAGVPPGDLPDRRRPTRASSAGSPRTTRCTTCCSGRGTCRCAPSLGVMAIAFYMVLLVSSANDWFAYYFDISLNATTWMGRIGLLVCRRSPTG